tara:strand:+ start:57 stop:1166 length:1110 start_codon:yes stop_codon:yes gene_type:complete
MDTKYAIETIGLVKRYPVNTRRQGGGGRGHGAVESFGNIFGVMKRRKGAFIEALRGVDLQIEKGEVFGLLGPNGAGKTTLIKVLCTLIIHDKGEAYVHGFDVKKHPAEVIRNLQAVLPESRGFNWRLSGRQNLEFYALLYGIREREAKERINYLLELVELEERADDGYQRYSTGMQRKLLLCRALLRDTPILLFDEPTAGLDPASAADFRSLVRDKLSHEEGKTVLISTHNLYEAQEACDRIAILDRGMITACDTPNNIQHTALNEKIFDITFIKAIFGARREKMLKALEKMRGVNKVTPDADTEKNFYGVSIRVNKNADLSGILEIVVKDGLKIGNVNTREPSLEKAFMAITGRNEMATAKSRDTGRS